MHIVFKNKICFIYFSSFSFPVTGFSWSSDPKNASAVNELNATSVKPASWTLKSGMWRNLPAEHNLISSVVFLASTIIFLLLKIKIHLFFSLVIKFSELFWSTRFKIIEIQVKDKIFNLQITNNNKKQISEISVKNKNIKQTSKKTIFFIKDN